MTSPLGPGARARLAVQRQVLSDDAFADVEPTWGSDPTGSLELEVDATAWVTDVRVTAVAEELRTPTGLTAALRSAISAAQLQHLARTAAALPATPEELARGRELEEGRRKLVAPPPYRHPRTSVDELRAEVGPGGIAPIRPDERLTRRSVGRSKEGEVTVVLGWVNGLQSVEVDAAWLRGASADMLRWALKEAFAAAQAEGDRAA
ncbi:hypothetical protein [Nocardioides sp.]|uniref:hypothetical protein n=1 Tax=Nocardioides sp. TaxID=35761 RepID=UPI0027322C4E|nr:hypothetical protein [Nocardioides sp.]MDP3893835.1 hypothetical protein [Nocardioides sp.]